MTIQFTPFLLAVIICAVLSYVIGSLPFGLWVGLARGVDIRTLGSRNIGATNVLRVLGPGPGGLVFLLDTLKGAVVILAARSLLLQLKTQVLIKRFGFTPDPLHVWNLVFHDLVIIGLCAVIGHTLSPFLRFKGGKGIATSLGMLLALDWRVALIGLGIFVVVLAATRYVSLGSLLASLSLPFSSYFLLSNEPRWWMLGMTAALFLFVTVKHKENIQRLLKGTESKFGQRVQPVESEQPESRNQKPESSQESTNV